MEIVSWAVKYNIQQSPWSDCMTLLADLDLYYLSKHTTKPTLKPVWPASTLISLYIHPVCLGFLLILLWIAWRLQKAHVISKDSDQSAQMCRRIWGFAGCTSYFKFCHTPAHLYMPEDIFSHGTDQLFTMAIPIWQITLTCIYLPLFPKDFLLKERICNLLLEGANSFL